MTVSLRRLGRLLIGASQLGIWQSCVFSGILVSQLSVEQGANRRKYSNQIKCRMIGQPIHIVNQNEQCHITIQVKGLTLTRLDVNILVSYGRTSFPSMKFDSGAAVPLSQGPFPTEITTAANTREMTIYIQNKNRLLITVYSGRLRNKVPPLGLQKQSTAKDPGGMHCDRLKHKRIVRGNCLKWADSSISRPRGEVSTSCYSIT